QTLETNIQQSAEFLTHVNIVPVDDQVGEAIGLGIGSTIAGTTDTTAKERETSDPIKLTKNSYHCQKTNYDTHLDYAKIDMWAKFTDFQTRIRDAIIRRQALDRIMIGFNGTHRADNSDRTKYPLLQDVNSGWLQKVRERAPEHVMGSETKDGATTAQPILVGKGQAYQNLDALVQDTVDTAIDPEYQDDTGLVVICGRKLLADKYFPLVNKDQDNSEKLAADTIISQKRIGGLPAVRAPFFPDNAFFITRLDNLSIYFLADSRRRQVLDNPKRDRIENYESVNEDFVVEDFRGVALVENIVFEDVKETSPETKKEGVASENEVVKDEKAVTEETPTENKKAK
ncbi:phage major capsid protein, P2 family, partial [Proteus mirabilis]|nr:phage major capsid protein, P2 family [Proteus mirabilis]